MSIADQLVRPSPRREMKSCRSIPPRDESGCRFLAISQMTSLAVATLAVPTVARTVGAPRRARHLPAPDNRPPPRRYLESAGHPFPPLQPVAARPLGILLPGRLIGTALPGCAG